MQDLRLPLSDGQEIQILTTRDSEDPDALAVLRHSSAHLLAEAARRLYPGVKVAIGPPIENGFYYDFEFPEPVHEDDLQRIEDEINRELKEGREWTREEGSADEARERFRDEPYKLELVDTAEGQISFYTQGDFTDLCRGPHLQNSKPIKALKLTSLAGAYWRGDEHNKQLTRIYGTAFYSREDLDAYLERLEEAKRRDHRRLGVQLDLFHLDDVSPGSPFWHPKGMVIWNALEDLRRRENRRRGYLEVKTPLLYDEQTYETSGHLQNYEENIFWVVGHEESARRFALKPMNCPGPHAALRRRACAATASCRCASPSRRRFTATRRAEPCTGCCASSTSRRTTRTSSSPRIRSRTRSRGWSTSRATSTTSSGSCRAPSCRLVRRSGSGPTSSGTAPRARCEQALKRHEFEYEIGEGEGTFYGPKIDLHMTDSLGRSWQMGTIQLDYQMPMRFGLTYVGADNEEHTSVVIHRALLGSLERFIGILVEHYAGAFPFWLAPVQIRILPVGEGHREAAQRARRRASAEFRVEVDDSDDTVGKRIRNAEVEKIPYVVVYGDKESDESLAVREHGGAQKTVSLSEFRAELATLLV